MGWGVSHCDFSADAGPHSSFHREHISMGDKLTTQPAEPLWRRDWRGINKTNKIKPAVSVKNNKTTEWEYGVVTSSLRPFEEHKSLILICPFSLCYHPHNTKGKKGGGRKKALETLCGSSLQESYLHWVQHSGSSEDKYSHILIFQLAWLLFSKHMQTQRGVY